MLTTNRILFSCAFGFLAVMTLACSSFSDEPAQARNEKEAFLIDVRQAIAAAKAKDPSIDYYFENAYGYTVLPSVGKGAFIVGGAHGNGAVYEQGVLVGWSNLSQASIGLQAGGQAYSEFIFFEKKAHLDEFKTGEFELAAQASAVAIESGAAASAAYDDGIAIFTMPKGGLMVEASVGGQQFNYENL